MIPYTFVTQSKNKLDEASRILSVPLVSAALSLPEIQSVDVEDVISQKAWFAYQALGNKPVIIEDTGLYFEAWNGLPGALIKWFLERVGTVGLCRMLDNFDNRKAVAKTIVATFDGQLNIFVGEVAGVIAPLPRGQGGFGWDAVFIPQGESKSFAEMSPEEKMRFSMRRKAFEAMAQHISANP